ncbi:MAG TPA: preprotein translocase subunit YajC [Gemmatimonadales bacterium]|nr:preprotein translocase subunit YajC [Gemmatimonadales bacterium]
MPRVLASLFTPSGQSGSGGVLVFAVQIGLFIAIFYFLLIRPQRRQQDEHKKLLATLQKGDQVVTSGGIIGEVIHLKDNEVTIRSGESRLVIMRSNVSNILKRPQAAESKQA